MQKTYGEKMMKIDYSTSDPNSQEFKITKVFADTIDEIHNASKEDDCSVGLLFDAVIPILQKCCKEIIATICETGK